MSRHRTSKTVSPRVITPGRIGTVLLLLAAMWLASGFVTRMMQASRLNSEVRAIQVENSRISQANLEYQQQLQALSAPDGAEEQARMHNYVKPDERVYIVTQPSPSPTPVVPSSAPRSHAQPVAKSNFWGDFWNALGAPLH